MSVARQARYPVIAATHSRKKPLAVTQLKTKLLACDAFGITRAAKLLNSGKTVAIPTETVYGLAADARSDNAVQKIFDAKGRPAENPLIIHLARPEDLPRFARAGNLAMSLAGRFWPGPLTLVLPAKENSGISRVATAGQRTVALRVPAHETARKILGAFGGPAAAPSANLSGHVSATAASHVLDDLGGRIDAVVDGGSCDAGIESTILAVEADTIQLLRSGAISAEDIESEIGEKVLLGSGTGAPPAPGRGFAHYAPKTRVRINADRPGIDEIWLGFGSNAKEDSMNLSKSGDLSEAASNLFQMLRIADKLAIESGSAAIAVSRVPDYGIGRAVNDRLRRAAEGRKDWQA